MKKVINFWYLTFTILIVGILSSFNIFTLYSQKSDIKSCVSSNCHNNILSKKNIHSPEIENCLKCHQQKNEDHPGTSGQDFVLRLKYPKSNYAFKKKENYALCFDCHDANLFLQKFTESFTNFRNDSINLHYLHVNRDKGRSCKFCHEVHSSNNPFLMKEYVKLENWDMPLNFQKNENGGTCESACHIQKKYSRISSIILVNETSNLKGVNDNLLTELKAHDSSQNGKYINHEIKDEKLKSIENDKIASKSKNDSNPDKNKVKKYHKFILSLNNNSSDFDENKIENQSKFKKLITFLTNNPHSKIIINYFIAKKIDNKEIENYIENKCSGIINYFQNNGILRNRIILKEVLNKKIKYDKIEFKIKK